MGFTTPLMSALSEKYGRKMLLVSSSLWCLLLRLFESLSPTARTMQICTSLSAPNMACFQGVRTSIGDLFAHDPKEAGGALAFMNVGLLFAGAVGPQIGGLLASRDLRFPFVFSALVAAIESFIILRYVPETRTHPAESKAVTKIWKTLHPFQFLELFSHGPRLGLLSLASLLSDLVEPRMLGPTTSLIHTSTLGWGIAQRARLSSMTAIIMAPGYAVAGKLCKTLGATLALLVALGQRSCKIC